MKFYDDFSSMTSMLVSMQYSPVGLKTPGKKENRRSVIFKHYSYELLLFDFLSAFSVLHRFAGTHITYT